MKPKTIFLTGIFSLFLVSGVWAQEKQVKYEFAVLQSYPNASISFTTAETQEITPTKLKDLEKDILKKLNELNEKGWEVYSTGGNAGFVYYLRKKKN